MFWMSRCSYQRKCSTGLALSLALMSLPAHATEANCGISSAYEAFSVEGLKSELMLTALSCKVQKRYNAFIAKFQPVLTDAENQLNTYFYKNYGQHAQVAHDDYITQLADVQSLGGLKSGTVFCEQREAMFDETTALKTASDLAHYADAKDVVQPASYETCSAPTITERRPHHESAHRKSRHHKRKH